MIEIKDDLFNHAEANSIIVHGVNCIGKWGAGFVVPLGKKFPESRKAFYRKHYKEGWKLNDCQIVKDNNVYIANCATQHDIYGYKKGKIDADYKAIALCLKKVIDFSNKNKLQIIMPKIGCGLAGGNWSVVSKIIAELEKDYFSEIKIFYL